MRLKLSFLLVAAALTSMAVQAAGVTDKMIENDAVSTGDVLGSGLGTQLQRYSPLKTINVNNVANLSPVWAFSIVSS